MNVLSSVRTTLDDSKENMREGKVEGAKSRVSSPSLMWFFSLLDRVM